MGMFEMWRQPLVQQFSGAADDEFQNEIPMPAKTHHDSDRLIGFWLKALKDGWGFRWAIIKNDGDNFVGHIGFNSLLECSEIAFHMNPDFWGNGFMYEAAAAAIAWRRDNGATAIEAYIEPENARSIALALRLGMNDTSTLVDNARRYQMSI
ncbi:hypothetical protein ACMU_14475 [Actibacterium mucosum KCTC 23349]|uniref:N-acetyltransferase domain-containing protein n=2 Tax=Actibacterium TaxID=1433986 RepID=A0A037ZJI3_9RHOB|nr:hypothetical protein ACMU_14475 [Actibacterium mucosum KCTC 23349]